MSAFVCEQCGQEFTAKTNLGRHQKTIKIKLSPMIDVNLRLIQNKV